MARIVLHVGTHKTATTTLQNVFAANRRRLARHGLVYPDIGRGVGHHGLVLGWADRTAPQAFRLPGGPEKAWKALARNHAGGDRTVLLSSEEFSRGHPAARADFGRIRAQLAAFDEVRVIAVLRDQLSFLQSIYLQISKRHAPPAWTTFLEKSLARGYASGLFLDYNALYDHLLGTFAPGEIRLVAFDEVRRHPGGIAGFFLEELGTGLTAGDLKKSRSGDANVSPAPLASWAASRIAGPKAATPDLVEFAAGLLAREFGAEARTTLYTKAEADRVVAHFAPLNARLAERGPQLAAAAPRIAPPPEDTVHRDALRDRFWIKAARALYGQRESA